MVVILRALNYPPVSTDLVMLDHSCFYVPLEGFWVSTLSGWAPQMRSQIRNKDLEKQKQFLLPPLSFFYVRRKTHTILRALGIFPNFQWSYEKSRWSSGRTTDRQKKAYIPSPFSWAPLPWKKILALSRRKKSLEEMKLHHSPPVQEWDEMRKAETSRGQEG